MDKVKQEVIAEKKVKAPIKKVTRLVHLLLKDKDVLLKQTIVAKKMLLQRAGGSYLKEVLGCFQHQNSGKYFAAFRM